MDEVGEHHERLGAGMGIIVDAPGVERNGTIIPSYVPPGNFLIDAHEYATDKEELSNLRREDPRLRRLVAKEGLKKSGVDVAFPQFSRIPLELRQFIWELACIIPTVHIVGDYYRPKNRCRMNVIMNVCKEARDYVLSLRSPYFIHDSIVDEFTYGKETTSMARNYFAPELDTFWLVRQDKDLLIANICSDTEWNCGFCDGIQPSETHGEDRGCHRDSKKLRCLAININDWNNPRDYFWDGVIQGWNLETARLIWQHRVEEVLLVVETFGEFHWEDEVHFVEPSELYRTAILKKNCLWELPLLWRVYGEGVDVSRDWADRDTRNWEEDGIRMRAAFEYYKQTRAAQRKIRVDQGLVSAQDSASSKSLIDLSDWKIPTFRFVEARKGSDLKRHA